MDARADPRRAANAACAGVGAARPAPDGDRRWQRARGGPPRPHRERVLLALAGAGSVGQGHLLVHAGDEPELPRGHAGTHRIRGNFLTEYRLLLLLLRNSVGKWFLRNMRAVSSGHGQNPILGRGLIGNSILPGIGPEGFSSPTRIDFSSFVRIQGMTSLDRFFALNY